SVSFMKPVGQLRIKTENGLEVDKDVVLFKEHFGISTSYELMSPVLCPSGFTRQVLDRAVDPAALLAQIRTSFQEIHKEHDFVLVEGTGHVGVGSIFELNNATVAKELDLEVVMIATGGLGSAIDELTLNIELLHNQGVRVRGVILNRVHDAKREMILNYFPKALKRWNIPLLGAVPFLPYLSQPTVQDFERLFQTQLLSGFDHRLRHFQDVKLVASSLESYLQEMQPNQLIITPACREDVVMATIEKEVRSQLDAKNSLHSGMILTGSSAPRETLLKEIKKCNIPILFTSINPYEVMKLINAFTAKIQKEDTKKIAQAIDLITSHVDFNQICC
ncbi:MAG TPA: AAA family ATPase, partial [Chlamydiales bacterium]|nr:AAA family ATPase [Chlamydiales bacterium]